MHTRGWDALVAEGVVADMVTITCGCDMVSGGLVTFGWLVTIGVTGRYFWL